jgi:hypothetical protein
LELRGKKWQEAEEDCVMRSFISCTLQQILLGRAGYVARVGEMRNAFKLWSENLKGRDHLEDLGVEGRIILECILGK